VSNGAALLARAALIALALFAAPLALDARADDRACEPADPTLGVLGDLGDTLGAPPPAPEAPATAICESDCGPRGEPGKWAGDGVCDDGGPGAKNSECEYGSDCQDCGPRGCDHEHPCGAGQTCVDGGCVFELGEVPRCDEDELEPLALSDGYGSSVTQFTPDTGDGWWDYPENGETEDDQYRSYLRRDVQQMIKYAASRVRCLSQGWAFGNREPLGLGDMSEQNGSIPGTRERDPGHPQGSHLSGQDIDIAYYQLEGPDNKLRPICEHVDHRGRDNYHCVSAPDNLDVFRTALFLALLHDSDRVRVIGVDGQVGLLLEHAFERLCDEGFLDEDSAICRGHNKLAYETSDSGRGWYRFHHHHFHLSTYGGKAARAPGAPGFVAGGFDECITPGCGG